jgi:hypothetical protein
MLDEKLAGFERSGARLQLPELYRLKGEAILMCDSSPIAAAEECFRQVVGIAAAVPTGNFHECYRVTDQPVS